MSMSLLLVTPFDRACGGETMLMLRVVRLGLLLGSFRFRCETDAPPG